MAMTWIAERQEVERYGGKNNSSVLDLWGGEGLRRYRSTVKKMAELFSFGLGHTVQILPFK
jgi:hypothetical protein